MFNVLGYSRPSDGGIKTYKGVLFIMLKINFVTMKEEIEDILMNSYDKFGNFDEPKATKELLNLFSVMNSNTKKQMEKYRDETAVETIARLQQKEYYS